MVIWELRILPPCLSAETLQGNLLGVNLAIGVCLPKLCSHLLRTRMCHSHTHLGKHFGCLRKAFSVLILLHYCQFWSPAHEFSEETLCLDLLTRSSVHRTPWFTMRCRLTPLMKTETNQFTPVASWKCLVCSKWIIPTLGHCQEICWVWTCQLWTADKIVCSPYKS